MNLAVVPLAEVHFEGLRKAFDSIAREKRYLAFLQAPPLEEGLAFYRNIVDNDLCHFVALLDDVAVGWCDVLPTHGEARAHVVAPFTAQQCRDVRLHAGRKAIGVKLASRSAGVSRGRR